MADPVTTNLGLKLSHPTSPDYRGEWPASMDENLEKIDAAFATAGGLAAPWSQSGATIEVTADNGMVQLTDTSSNVASLQPGLVQISAPGRVSGSLSVNGSASQLQADIVLANTTVDLSNGADIIDSTGSHGTAGQVLSSLGSGSGVKWITP